jgi:mRNA-degrading endonuclease RelE of RelBE toxin-antitoxin system
MEFRQSKKFERELKKLLKKYRSLQQDIKLLEQVLIAAPLGKGGKHWNQLYVSADEGVIIFKVRLACKSMKGESRFRIIYAYNQRTKEFVFIDFLEIYFKGHKENNDQTLIDEYLQDNQC